MVPILVLITFISIAVVSTLVQKSKQKSLMASLGMTQSALPEYQFTPGHLWLDQMASGFLRVGFDELIQKFMGTPDKIHFVDEGELVKTGETLVIITKGDKDLFLRAPANMRIWKTNKSLNQQTDTINHDPYYKGWLYRVSLENDSPAIKNLLTGQKARLWLNEEIQRLKEFVTENLHTSVAVPNTAFDGGLLMDGLIDKFDQSTVSEFEKLFLMDEFLEHDETKK